MERYLAIRLKVDTHMKGISVLLYSIKQGIKNLRHNGLFTLASVGTISACLFLFGIFYFIVSNFQYMVKNAETSVGITVFFNENIGDDAIASIGDKIRARGEVSEVIFVSADEAWEKFKGEVFAGREEEIAQTFGDDNPLVDSASYEVYLSDVSGQGALSEYIKSIDGVREVKGSIDAATGLTNVNKLIGYVSAAIIIILLAVSIFLINTTISTGVSVRKEEISIMRLVGATDLFIKMPFIIEGIIIGIIGAALPLAVLYFMYGRIVNFVGERFSVLSGILIFLDEGTVFSVLVPICVCLGVGIGYIGSIWTLRRHVRV